MPVCNADTSLQDWLAWLETLHPKEIDLGLDRIAKVYAAMGCSRPADHVITVAGTNGKGSIIALMETALLNAGYTVGCYTSPHLLDYNERIRIAGIDVHEKTLCNAFACVDEARGDTSLSYFEFGTLAAFRIMQRHHLDVALLEVGLGGRLDAVNIIDPDVSVISSIAIDHEAWLGNDREAIGAEKAGIARVGRPLICGDRHPPNSVREVAEQLGANLLVQGEDFDHQGPDDNWQWSGRLGDKTELLTMDDLPASALIGRCQRENASTAIAALQSLTMLPVDATDIRQGLEFAQLAGRYQQIADLTVQQGLVPCIVDVAHNPHSVAALAQRLSDDAIAGQTHAVFAAMADKDIAAMVKELCDSVDVWYLTTVKIPRAAEAAQLQTACASAGISSEKIRSSETVETAIADARANAGPNDRIVVFGSFYTVAEAMSLKL